LCASLTRKCTGDVKPERMWLAQWTLECLPVLPGISSLHPPVGSQLAHTLLRA
jgi:hypothetical protein